MNRTLPVSLVLLLSSTSAFGWRGDGCEFRADRSLDIDAQGLAAIEILARAGDLEVIGDPGLTAIEVRGKACAEDESLLAGVKLAERRDGDRLLIEVVIPESDGWVDAQASIAAEREVTRSFAGTWLNIPRYSAGGAATYAFDAAGVQWRTQASYSYRDRQEASRVIFSPEYDVAPYALVNATITALVKAGEP